MTLLAAALLGIVQGLTEFLPVSSTAHLLLGARLLDFKDPGGVFTVTIQLGSILAVMWLYRAKIIRVITGLPTDPEARHFALMVFVAFIPAAVAGALFAGYVKRVLYTTPAVTQVHFGATDASSDAYIEGANWVGVLFGAYNGFAALAAIVIPIVAARLGLRMAHLGNLFLGGLALISFRLIHDPSWLLAAMVGIGFAWASILSVPYALLANSVPAEKMGLYMGIFNMFIVIPQLVAAALLSSLLKHVFGGQPISILVLGGASFILAGLLVLRVPEPARFVE